MTRIPINLHKIKIPSAKRYFKVKEVAELFDVTPLTIRNWDKKGKLKSLRHPINNYRIYKPQDVELFIRKIESQGKIILG